MQCQQTLNMTHSLCKVIERHSKGRCAPNEIRTTSTLAESLLANVEMLHEENPSCEESVQQIRGLLNTLREANAAMQTLLLENADTERYDAITDERQARTLYKYSVWGFCCDGYNAVSFLDSSLVQWLTLI